MRTGKIVNVQQTQKTPPLNKVQAVTQKILSLLLVTFIQDVGVRHTGYIVALMIVSV